MADVLSQDGRGAEPERDRRSTAGEPEARLDRDRASRLEIEGPFEIIIGGESLSPSRATPPEAMSEPEQPSEEPDLVLSDEPTTRTVAHFGTELLAALVLVGVVGVVVSTLVLSSDHGASI